MEQFVTFETANLLKENGFDGRCYKVWEKHDNGEPNLVAAAAFVEGEPTATKDSVDDAAAYMANYYSVNNKVEGFLAPTQAAAMRWLRDEKEIAIVIKPYPNEDGFAYAYEIKRLIGKDDFTIRKVWNVESRAGYCTYEDACEGAIKYCLKELIDKI